MSAFFNSSFTASSQTMDIGGNAYTVSVVPGTAFSAPGTPPVGGSGLPGEYSLDVQVSAQPVPLPAPLWCGAALFAIAGTRATRWGRGTC